MTKQEIINLMESDMQLWEKATTGQKGNKVTKTLHDLPFGIGDYTVTFEGMSNAEQRRAAVSAFGDHIRDLIEEHINDEIITSKAQQQAARVSEDSGAVSGGGGSDTGQPEKVLHGKADTAPTPSKSFAENVFDRISELGRRAGELRTELEGIEAELNTLQKVYSVLQEDTHAPTDSRTTETSAEGEGQSSDRTHQKESPQ